MSSTPPAARGSTDGRRRHRRGSLERPINGRLYRSAFLLTSLPLLVLAFSVTRPGALSAPSLPPNFDGPGARALAGELASRYPDRAPGTAGALGAGRWFRDKMRLYGLPVTGDTWHEHVQALGRVRLENLWAVAAGRSQDALVVLAHRDDSGAGPGANDDASGTAAVVELARGYAQAGAPPGQRVHPEHTIVFLSTDGGSFGGLGAARFAARLPFHVIAVVNLDSIAGRGPPRIDIAGDTPRSPAAGLVETAARRVLEQTGERAGRAGFAGQLLDLAFPLTLYEQGPFVARGVPAITVSTAGERPPDAFRDRIPALDTGRLAGLGRATQELIGSLDQSVTLAQTATSFVWAGDRIVRGWAIELMLFALVLPYLVAVVDLFAHCRRRRISLTPAVRSLRTRALFWLFGGAAFLGFRSLGAWPPESHRPPNPATAAAGDWPVLALLALGGIVLLGWIVARHRLVPRRVVAVEEELGGELVALIGLSIVALLVLATNAFALLFLLPMLHAWLWLPQVRGGRLPARALVFALGLAGPLMLPLSVGVRFDLGFDAPWYILELVSGSYVPLTTVVVALAGAACAAQLAAAAAGRYAPYPGPRERPARGPIRSVVRAVALAIRARRRVQDERRQAFGG